MIHQACGGHYGGNTVNEEFFKFLERLLSGPVIREIQTKHPSEYFELMSAFEQKKTCFTDKGRQKSTKLQTMMYKTLHRSLKFER
jgi:hypothetical protein